MATKRASNLFWSILAALILVFALFAASAAADQPPDVSDTQQPPELDTSRVKFHLWCMTSSYNYTYLDTCNPMESPCLLGCKLSYGDIQNRYWKTGWLPEEYVEALRIFHNYNQTDVDIDICKLDYTQCPNKTMALRTRCTSTEIRLTGSDYYCFF
ncbi:hypothetical protein ACP275_10G148800 [Erythranthe tilingii]